MVKLRSGNSTSAQVAESQPLNLPTRQSSRRAARKINKRTRNNENNSNQSSSQTSNPTTTTNTTTTCPSNCCINKQRKLSKEDLDQLKNYRPPRKCTFKLQLDSFTRFISNFSYSNQRYDNLWNNCDSLIDDVSQMLNQDMYGSLSLTEHCERLNSCFNVLKRIHDTASRHINLIKSKISATDYHLQKWATFLNYISITNDIEYLKAWKIYHGWASSNMQRLQKINRILYAELDIANKYSQLTSRTIGIFSTAASRTTGKDRTKGKS